MEELTEMEENLPIADAPGNNWQTSLAKQPVLTNGKRKLADILAEDNPTSEQAIEDAKKGLSRPSFALR